MPSSDRNAPIFLAGPTAVGKSEIALRLAETIGGEIISVDSMQVYRGLDLGTAKPTPAERARVAHHLIDVVGLTEAFDAARFVTLAGAAVEDIQSRGRVPVFCGGTGLYFKAFREGLGAAPPSDAALRAELEAAPLETLLGELRELDPVTYERIDRQNPRRVIRAVEVIRLTGRPFSAQRANWPPASRLPPPRSSPFPEPLPISTGALNSAWKKCSRKAWWTKRAACSKSAWRKTEPPCKPSATGSQRNICAANGR